GEGPAPVAPRAAPRSPPGLPAGGAAAPPLAVTPQVAAEARTEPQDKSRPGKGTVVHLLGTAGGPPPYGERMGIASAVTVGTDTDLVDCGRAAVTQSLRAGLSIPSLKGIFLTHLPADATAASSDLPLRSPRA